MEQEKVEIKKPSLIKSVIEESKKIRLGRNLFVLFCNENF